MPRAPKRALNMSRWRAGAVDNIAGAQTGQVARQRYKPLLRKLKPLKMPDISVINAAAGAGVNMALRCDIVIAFRNAPRGQAFCRLGLTADRGGR